MFFAQDRDVAVLDELVGPADPHDRRVDHLRVEMFHDRAAKTVVQDVVLDRADDLHAAGEKLHRAGVERLDPARVDERDGDALRFQFAAPLPAAISNMLPRPKIATSLAVLARTSALPISSSFGVAFGFAPVPAPRG